MASFETVLPRLAATYEQGRLVPFIGSGMSVPTCTDWNTFVRRLEEAVSGRALPPYDRDTARDTLIRKANNAVRSLKASDPKAFERGVRAALLRDQTQSTIPTQTMTLAELWWPLVLSTNYDNCYAAAATREHPDQELAIVGRSAEDCQRVLNSLSVAGRSILWALQGYLDAPHALPADADPARYRRELVIGHEEYRRVTYRDLHFRRAFAEVFRQRSLLFLGAGIQETYLQELFGEVLEYYGPSTRPHYAFIQEGEVDPAFLLARFQIIAVEYKKNDHDEVIKRLRRLIDVVRSPDRAPVSWSWGKVTVRGPNDWISVPDLEVHRGPLPTARVPGECLAVSAGGSGDAFFLSEGIWKAIQSWSVDPQDHPARLSDYLGEFSSRDVFAVRARTGHDERSLSHIYDASLDLFEQVARRYSCIHLQLLATGGVDKLGASAAAWNVRTYPPRFSFVQTVRAWGAWRERNPTTACRLVLHVVLESVYIDIASGRIDVLELLSCHDLRFFVEVMSDGGELERRLFQMMPQDTLGRVIAELQLSAKHWEVRVTPPPSTEAPTFESSGALVDQTLLAMGVVPGSTLHFRRTTSTKSSSSPLS